MHGFRVSAYYQRALRAYPLACLGDFAAREHQVTGLYALSALLALALGGYLLYALIRPEKF
jgi:K+-transporting ATPase KdpF subunit